MTWLEEHQEELALLHKLGRKVASGLASMEEGERFGALQKELGLATDALCQGAALTKLEHELDQLDAVRKQVETFLAHEDKEHG
jgi:hypothetical protein